jgi:hypothetical protein
VKRGAQHAPCQAPIDVERVHADADQPREAEGVPQRTDEDALGDRGQRKRQADERTAEAAHHLARHGGIDDRRRDRDQSGDGLASER